MYCTGTAYLYRTIDRTCTGTQVRYVLVPYCCTSVHVWWSHHIPYMYVQVLLVLVRVQVPYSCIVCSLYVYCYCTSWESGVDRCIPQTLSCIQKNTTVVQNCNTDQYMHLQIFHTEPCQNAGNARKQSLCQSSHKHSPPSFDSPRSY